MTYPQFGVQVPGVNMPGATTQPQPFIGPVQPLPVVAKKTTAKTPVAKPTVAPLPQVANVNQPQQVPQRTDPIETFNKGLLALLGKAQGVDPATLLNEKNRLQVSQINNSMAPGGFEGLAPDAALAARGRAADMLNPEIKNITDRLQASVSAVANFKDAIDAASKYGEKYSEKMKPTDEVIAAAQAMLEAGHNPSSAVLDKVSQYIDWGKVAQADKAGKNNGGGTPSQIEKGDKQTALNEVLDKWNSGYIQGNGTVSSKDYKTAKEAWMRKFGAGSAKEFDNEFSGYIDKSGAKWQQDYGISNFTEPNTTEVRRQDNGDGTTTIFYSDGTNKKFAN